jgi:rhodanese-related sulfurtransferase
MNIPLSCIADDSTKINLDPLTITYLICNDASKADVAADALRRRGYKDIFVLAGGLKSWSALGFDLEKRTH